MNPDPEGSSIEIGGVPGGVLGSVLGNTLVNPDCGETRASGRRTGESSLGFDASQSASCRKADIWPVT